ncbi:MAG: serine/threonine protein kinase [Phycisphaeraceae bacterium]|nr:MAG: serine/threonine protein kinase [Phycisphaeraceae bacterium]
MHPGDEENTQGGGGGGGPPDVSSFHDMPTEDPAPRAAPLPAYTGLFSGLREGTKVPGYTIQQMLGEGGMGAVYLAEQARPRRTVALKMIRPDRVSAVALKRFDYEAQMLASLQHPGIASVYEVGSFEIDGMAVPYFAMEYIAGARSLTEYARLKDLGIRERLALFLKVCDAVQHGHQQGIIHRDLKPANILVDEGGEPRIIDFGVARSAGPDRAMATMRTEVGQIVGTLQYMSPEQCSSQAPADMRSDVYALGTVLFELLTGRVPHDVRTLTLPEAVKVITEIPSPSLSAVRAALGGDLTVIVGKALEKDRRDRYQSVSEFAGDIRRYLADQPILARPTGPIGLLRKWVKRNRQLAAAIGAAAAVLIITSAVLIGRIVAAEQRASQNLVLAERNLAASRESVDLVRDMLNFRGPDGESRIREGMVDIEVLLDDAASSITQAPPELAGTEADFRELLGVGYISLRSVDKAKAQLERALALRRANTESPSPELADAIHGLARAHYFAGEFDQALPLYQEALEMRRALHPGDDKDTAFSLTHVAATLQRLGRLDEAQRLFGEALAMRQRLFGAEHEDIAASLNNLGNLLFEKGDAEGAERRLSESLKMIAGLKEPTSLEVSNASHNLARVVLARGRAGEAAELYRRALSIREARLKPDDGRVWSSRFGLAHALLGGIDPEDEGGIGKGLDGAPSDRASALERLGGRLMSAQRWKDAALVLGWSVEITRNALAGDRQGLAYRLALGAECATAIDDLDKAETLLTESSTLRPEGVVADEHNRAVEALVKRLTDSGRADAARRCEDLRAR